MQVNIRIGGCVGSSEHAIVEFAFFRNIHQAKCKIRKLSFRKANFQLFSKLVNKTPWKSVLEIKEVEQSCHIFKEAFLRAQELSVTGVGSQDRKARDWHDLNGTC